MIERLLAESSPGDIAVAVAGFVLSAGALVAAWLLLRRWWRRSVASQDREPIWSLQQLRELRASGQLSDAEYERIRAELVRDARGTDAKRTDAGASRAGKNRGNG